MQSLQFSLELKKRKPNGAAGHNVLGVSYSVALSRVEKTLNGNLGASEFGSQVPYEPGLDVGLLHLGEMCWYPSLKHQQFSSQSS